jgi:UDP-glucose 4-epimerase
MIHAWVLGSGGMLGSAINRQLEIQGIAVYRYSEKFDWTNIERLRIQFRIALEEFTDRLSSKDQWEIYWAAGVGAMNSKADELRSETLALEELLRLLQQKLLLLKFPGLVGFASSAGAFYSSCDDFKITELSSVTAQTDYAKAKLAQEHMLIRFLSKVNGVRLLLARFSTLYGPGQSFGKQQGLLSHIARCALRQQPIEIFVPLDTLRDYMFSDDAAINFIRSLRLLCIDNCKYRIEIIASEQSITISHIISTFSKLIQKHLRLIFSRNHLTNLYAARISYQSIYRHNADNSQRRQYTLAEGINSVLMAERIDYLNSPGSGLVTPPKS